MLAAIRLDKSSVDGMFDTPATVNAFDKSAATGQLLCPKFLLLVHSKNTVVWCWRGRKTDDFLTRRWGANRSWPPIPLASQSCEFADRLIAQNLEASANMRPHRQNVADEEIGVAIAGGNREIFSQLKFHKVTVEH